MNPPSWLAPQRTAMGIYDREYYRREGPSFLRSLTEGGAVCKWIIIVNVVVFVLQTVTATPDGGWFTEAFSLRTSDVLHGYVWQLVTYAFCHGGIWHIIFNMYVLWLFGIEV